MQEFGPKKVLAVCNEKEESVVGTAVEEEQKNNHDPVLMEIKRSLTKS